MEQGWAELGHTIRRQRKAAGPSQEGLAERAGLHWTYISEIETGKRNISVGVLRRIADALGIRTSQLVIEAEEPTGSLNS